MPSRFAPPGDSRENSHEYRTDYGPALAPGEIDAVPAADVEALSHTTEGSASAAAPSPGSVGQSARTTPGFYISAPSQGDADALYGSPIGYEAAPSPGQTPLQLDLTTAPAEHLPWEERITEPAREQARKADAARRGTLVTHSQRAREAIQKRGPRPRLFTLDLVRGIAVLGIFVGILGAVGLGENNQDYGYFYSLPNPTWLGWFHGRSETLLLVTVGISAAMVARTYLKHPGEPYRPTGSVVRTLLTHAVLLGIIGAGLSLLGTRIDNILVVVAIGLAFTPVALRFLGKPWPIVVGILLALAGSALVVLWAESSRSGSLGLALPYAVPEYINSGNPLINGTFAPLVYVGYACVGVGVGQSDLYRKDSQRRVFIAGLLLAVSSYAASFFMRRQLTLEDDFLLRALVEAEPNTETPLDVLGSLGVALAVVGGVLYAFTHNGTAQTLPRALLSPIAAVGRMPVTIYALLIMVVSMVGSSMIVNPANINLAAAIVLAFAIAAGWLHFFKRGPLEMGIWATAKLFAGPEPLGPRAARPSST